MDSQWRQHASDLTTIPNLVTLSRLPLIALIVVLLETPWRYPLFLLVVATDGLDGWLARKLDQTTELGAMLDPALDKLTAVALFFVLFARTALAWEYLVLFFARDLYVLSLGLLVPFVEIPDTSKIKARPLGKAVTNLQFVTMLALLVPHEPASIVLLWLLGVTSALAISDYVVFVARELTDAPWVHTRQGVAAAYAGVAAVFVTVVSVFLREQFGQLLALAPG
jgi:cardiolipin synthase